MKIFPQLHSYQVYICFLCQDRLTFCVPVMTTQRASEGFFFKVQISEVV